MKVLDTKFTRVTYKAAKPIRFVKNNKNPCFNFTKYFNLSLNQRMTKN